MKVIVLIVSVKLAIRIVTLFGFDERQHLFTFKTLDDCEVNLDYFGSTRVIINDHRQGTRLAQ